MQEALPPKSKVFILAQFENILDILFTSFVVKLEKPGDRDDGKWISTDGVFSDEPTEIETLRRTSKLSRKPEPSKEYYEEGITEYEEVDDDLDIGG